MMQRSIILRRVMCIKSIEKIGITVTNSTTTFFQSDFDINKSYSIFSKQHYCILSIDVPTNLTEAMYHSEISYNLPIFYKPKKYDGENR